MEWLLLNINGKLLMLISLALLIAGTWMAARRGKKALDENRFIDAFGWFMLASPIFIALIWVGPGWLLILLGTFFGQ